MATVEKDTLIRTKNSNGDIEMHYPITKAKNVDGLTEMIASIGQGELPGGALTAETVNPDKFEGGVRFSNGFAFEWGSLHINLVNMGNKWPLKFKYKAVPFIFAANESPLSKYHRLSALPAIATSGSNNSAYDAMSVSLYDIDGNALPWDNTDQGVVYCVFGFAADEE